MILSPRKEAVTEGLRPPSPLFAVKHLILAFLEVELLSELVHGWDSTEINDKGVLITHVNEKRFVTTCSKRFPILKI